MRGKYIEDREKEWNTTRRIHINWTNDVEAEIKQNVEKYVEKDGQTIVETSIKTQVKENKLPIGWTKVKANTLEIDGQQPDDIKIIANTKSTNGKELGLQINDFSWDRENHTVEFTQRNNDGDYISWIKNSSDNYKIIYIYNNEFGKDEFSAELFGEVEINTINDINIKKDNKTNINIQKNNNVINTNVYATNSVNKGFLYLNNDDQITSYNTYYDLEVIDQREQEIEIEDKTNNIIGNTNYNIYNNSYYLTTKIKKEQIENILGENGTIEFYDENNEKITGITRYTQADENGNIVINFQDFYMKKLHIKIVNPERVGNILFDNTKAIRNNNTINKQIINDAEKIEEIVAVKANNMYEEKVNSIKLENTITQIDCEINQNRLSSIEENDVILTARLREDDNKFALFKNPKIAIEMPSQILDINVENISLLYNEEFKINSAEIVENDRGNKVILLGLEGQSNRYKINSSNIDIVIPMKIKLKEDTITSYDTIKVQYENEDSNRISYIQEGKEYNEVGVDLISKDGLIKIFNVTNKTTNETSKTYNDEIKYIEFQTSENKQLANVNKTIINNYADSIYDVNIIGRIPYTGNKDLNGNELGSNLDTILENGILKNDIDADIYYSEDIDAKIDSDTWTQEINDYTNVKSYKIVLKNEMKHGDRIDLNYNLVVPENMEFNKQGLVAYSVLYKHNEENCEETQKIAIATPKVSAELNSKGAENETTLKMNITGKVGTKDLNDGDILHEHEIVKYRIEVRNDTNLVMKNVETEVQLPREMVWVTVNDNRIIIDEENGNLPKDLGRYQEHLEEKTLINKIEEIKPGESVIKEYEIKAKEVGSNLIVSTNFVTKINGQEESRYTINNKIVNAEIKTDVDYFRQRGGAIKDTYDYYYYIKNLTDHDVEELTSEIYISDKLEVYEINILVPGIEETAEGYNENTVAENKENVIMLNTKKISKGNRVRVEIRTRYKQFSESNVEIDVAGKTTVNNEEYQSNIATQKIEMANISLTKESDKTNEEVKEKDIIKYIIKAKNESNSVNVKTNIKDVLPKELLGISAKYNKFDANEEIGPNTEKITFIEREREVNLKTLYNEENTEMSKVECSYNKNTNTVNIPTYIPAGETITIEMEARVENINETKDISNIANITGDLLVETNSNEIKHHVTKIENKNDGNNNNGENDQDNNNGDNNGQNGNSISGYAWIDSNKDGKKDTKENMIGGIKVKAVDSNTGEFIKDRNGNDIETTTDVNSGYTISNLNNGKYTIVFEYDNNEYSVTKYKATTDESKNSNAIQAEKNETKYAVTEIININNSNIENINIGLIKNSNMNISFKKLISSVTVTDKNKSRTYTMNKQLGKVELNGKKINNSNVVIRYKFNIKNNGDKASRISNLKDTLPNGLDFNSNINKNWYIKGNEVIYKDSQELRPGEEKNIELVLTKRMTGNNLGTVSNSASIELTDNSGKSNIKLEDKANLILGIKTGKKNIYISSIIAICAIAGISVYIIKSKIV